jgi:Transposase DDE domain
MRHQDHGRDAGERTNADDLSRALQWITARVCWLPLPWRAECTWTPRELSFAALLWAWSDEKTLTDRFRAARKIICRLRGEQDQPATSYQAFVKLLGKWTEPLRVLLTAALQQQAQASLAPVWKVAGWIVLAVDGSRVDVPRTRGNEQRYSPRSKLSRAAQKRRRARRSRRYTQQEARERKANVPRIWLTMLWHVGSGLPWSWRAGPADSSERAHLLEMAPQAPPKSLITADAGFVGYDVWQSLLDTGHNLLIRVGSNVRLLKHLGYAKERHGLVYLWPDQKAKKHLPPLMLRLIQIHDGSEPMYLVTSVLDEKQLTDAQAVAIYRRRWGIELFYRHCKQTFERRKLRSHNPDNAMQELHWSLLGIWAMGLHSHHQLLKRGIMPERVSFARVLRAYRQAMRQYKSPPDPHERLTDLLNLAIIDDYQRTHKHNRHYPQKKQRTRIGPPIINPATRTQIKQAKQLQANFQRRLTA